MTNYGPELAAIHDADFGWAAIGAAEVLLEEIRRRELSGPPVVEFGCGSGIMSKIVSEAGYDLLGIDRSAAMLDIARRKAPRALFVKASVVDFEPPECIAATAIGEVLNYRFDERASLTTVKKVFRRVFDALVSGGVFLFDLSGPGRGGPTGAKEVWHDKADYSMFFRGAEDTRRKRLIRDQIMFVKKGSTYQRFEERHELNLYDPAAIDDALRSIGYKVRHLKTYPHGPLLQGWTVFLASKPRR